MRRGARPALALALGALLALRPGASATPAGGRARQDNTLTVFNAGSLARPLRAALDSYALRAHVTIEQENAGSLETARKLTELHKIPDVIALADEEVFPQLLMPGQTTWYAQFARNRMVIAYTDRSHHAAEVNARTWIDVLARPDVEVGRADPNLDPNGYRTLLTLQLAERWYHRPGLYRRLLASSPERDVRPKEADLVGLLQAGEMDYIWSYESIAQGAGLRYVELPPQIDFSSPAESTFYARAVVRVTGATPADTVEFRGHAIMYGLSIPRAAPHREIAERFVAWLLSPDGRRVLRDAKLGAVDAPGLVGTGVPAAVARAAAER